MDGTGFLKQKERTMIRRKYSVLRMDYCTFQEKSLVISVRKREFKNFHLAVEFKWGIKKYPPRDADTTKRDNGICYYMPLNAKDTVWPKSIECQIQEGDVGDFWLIDSVTIIADSKRTIPQNFCRVQKKA